MLILALNGRHSDNLPANVVPINGYARINRNGAPFRQMLGCAVRIRRGIALPDTDEVNKIAAGSCLCGKISYEISGNLKIFQYCRCSRCRKFTGSASSANLLVSPDQFRWVKGADGVKTHIPSETRHFATAFCPNCGSSLPWVAKTGKAVIVPAGTLDTDPGISPSQNVFCGSQASWFVDPAELPSFDELPPRNPK